MFSGQSRNHSIFNTLDTISSESDCSMGHLLPSFNPHLNRPRGTMPCVLYDSILAHIWHVDSTYHRHSTDGLFIYDTFCPMAVLSFFYSFISTVLLSSENIEGPRPPQSSTTMQTVTTFF
jgi:hypothetical protein